MEKTDLNKKIFSKIKILIGKMKEMYRKLLKKLYWFY